LCSDYLTARECVHQQFFRTIFSQSVHTRQDTHCDAGKGVREPVPRFEGSALSAGPIQIRERTQDTQLFLTSRKELGVLSMSVGRRLERVVGLERRDGRLHPKLAAGQARSWKNAVHAECIEITVG